MSVLRIGPGRTETEPRLSIPEDNPKILLECDILLGPDNGRPKVYVMQKSKKLLSNVRQAFSKLENIECATFGLHSYFAGRDEAGRDVEMTNAN